MPIHFLLQLSHSNCNSSWILSVVGSTQTHLFNWVLLLIIQTAEARGPIKDERRLYLTKKSFFLPFNNDFSFVVVAFTDSFKSRVRTHVFWEAVANTSSKIEMDVADLKALLCIMCLDLLVSAVDVWDFLIWKLWKVLLGKNYISDRDRDKSSACNKSSNKRWNKHLKERWFFCAI